ncbi:hypothetical protein [Devosia lacusdianchii]|uniref:hypothetical protein n=1 Tax=Devosia lacusdianchii TaxID=2917991 RepID=UPI001F055F16|nr:hypothetical protein [Devosia sp. JXJ CY 41]
MMVTAIQDPAKFLQNLADLHDADVIAVSYDVESHRLEIELGDISWNLTGKDGLAEQSCTLIFSGVSAFAVCAGQDKFHTSIAATEPAVISRAYTITKNGVTRFDIWMTTSELWYVEFLTLAAQAEVTFP